LALSKTLPSSIPQPKPFEELDDRHELGALPEREMVRILDAKGNLVASPRGRPEDIIPLSADGLASLQIHADRWETVTIDEFSYLVFNHPVLLDGKLSYIIQVARPLTEQARSLKFLVGTLLAGGLITVLTAFAIGWVFSKIILDPIQKITQTAQAIGDENDFSRRVQYNGPRDEIGALAHTFNGMLEKLQGSYKQVAHSLDMQREFVADVSHELRTPLTTLRGNIGLLRREPPLPSEEQADILADVNEESDRMIRLVNELLVLARADAGRNLSLAAFNLSELLEETTRQARLLDPARGIDCDAGEGLVAIGDKDAVKQVLLIGVDNALKHSSGSVRVTAKKLGNVVEMRVIDSGEGITPEKLEHLFDRFYRGEDAATIPGFGLGLPIARSLVQGMGGDIRMVSEEAHGSQLVITLPVG
jgi:signal transduction histidine kinase